MGGRRGRITRYDNKAGTRETEDAKYWRRDPKRRKKRTKSRVQNQKEGVVAWASCGGGKTLMQERRSKLGGVGGWAVDDKRTAESKSEGGRTSIT